MTQDKGNVVTFGSLFAGIGGFDLGFERAGMSCSWQVEIDPYCRKVLAKHWPDVRRWDDVRTFPPEPADDWRVDVICGGFPCQDISSAGKRSGIDGRKSGLWSEYMRIVRVLRPRYVVVENVADLLVRGLGRVLGELAESGYDAEWDCLPAWAFGLPHVRDRTFIIAYANSDLRQQECDTTKPRFFPIPQRNHIAGLADAQRHSQEAIAVATRMDDGVPGRLDRNRSLGNAVVPQVAEWIGRRLMEADGGAA